MLLPLAYFGNRGLAQADFFALILQLKQQRNKKFHCCYDLFAGSASISLYAIQHDIAERYIINDRFKPLAMFWKTVRDQPAELIQAYNNILKNYSNLERSAAENYYQELQAKFNQLNAVKVTVDTRADYAAQFAFIINHANHGMPLLSGQAQQQILQCELIATAGKLAIDENFAEAIQQVHKLFQAKEIHFSHQDFQAYQDNIMDQDLVLLDPPYPDMPDANQQPDKHIYLRSEPKSELQQALDRLLIRLDKIGTPFLMFYGVLGMENNHPIHWPKGHILRLSGDQQGPFNEYAEHIYLSKELAQIVVQPGYQGKLQPCFYRIFETQAIHNKHKIALVWDEQKWTYDVLNKAVNRMANYLLQMGLAKQLQQNSESLVTIYLDRGPQLIVNILAVMKTGAAYLPLDTNAKQLEVGAAYERIQQSGSQFVITHQILADQLKKQTENKVEKIDWDKAKIIQVEHADYLGEKITVALSNDPQWQNNLNCEVKPESLAYVMYTSGSTGKPKGVEVLQRGLPYAFESHQDLLNLGPKDKVAQFGSIGFDASLMEIMMALGVGAELHLVNEDNYKDAAQLTSFLQSHEISVAIQTPKMLETLKPTDFPDLRALLIVGDSFPKTLSDQWQVSIQINGDETTRHVVNGYGLTETTICTTLELCDPTKALTIGQPILGCEVYLRPLEEEENDLASKEVTIGDRTAWLQPKQQEHLKQAEKIEKGALYISGPCLARGYWNNPAETQQRFKTVSFNGKTTTLYQSGDVGYFARATGEVSLSGRIDRQVKIRGQRMELGELEMQLLKLAEGVIKEARVVVQDQVVQTVEAGTSLTTKRLAIYLVPTDPKLVIKDRSSPTSKSLKALKKLREKLLQHLPSFMCPALVDFLFVDQLIYKDNDKKSPNDVEMKKRWSTPCLVLPHAIPQAVNKLLPEEKADFELMRKLIAKSLGIDSKLLSYTEDYYAQGGDSLTVKWLLEALKKQKFFSELMQHALQTLTVETLNKDSSVIGIWQTLQEYINTSNQKQDKFNNLIGNHSVLPSKKLLLLETGFYKDDGQSFQNYIKVSLPVYAIHSLLGDADLDYSGTQLDQLPCHYTRMNTPSLSNWKTLEELAEQHIIALERKHPLGEPYWLIGWSSGGLIARLIAEQLRAQGKRVFVLLLDTHHPVVMQKLNEKQYAQNLLEIAQKIKEGLCSVWQLPVDIAFTFTLLGSLQQQQTKTHQIKQLFKDLHKEAERLQSQVKNMDPSLCERGLRLIQCSEKLLTAELSYDGNNRDYLTDDDTLLQAYNSTKQWGELLGWRVKFGHQSKLLKIETDHFSLLRQGQLSHQLKPWLEERLLSLKSTFYDGIDCLFKENFKEGVKKFSEVIEHNPASAAAFNHLGLCKSKMNDQYAAIDDYNKAISLDSNFVLAINNRGVSYDKLGQYQMAIQDYDKVLQIDASFVEAYVDRGNAKNKSDNAQGALTDFNKALQLDPKNARAYAGRGLSKNDLKQYKEALCDFDEAIKIDPENAESFANRGNTYNNLGKFKAALNDCNEAIKLNPKLVFAHMGSALAKNNLNDFKGALENFNNVLMIEPKNTNVYILRGIALMNMSKLEAAQIDFIQAIKFHPENIDAYYKLSHAKLAQGNFQGALDVLDWILKQDPSVVSIYLIKASVKFSLGKYTEVLKDLTAAIELDVNNILAYALRGIAKFNLTRYEEALSDLKKANVSVRSTITLQGFNLDVILKFVPILIMLITTNYPPKEGVEIRLPLMPLSNITVSELTSRHDKKLQLTTSKLFLELGSETTKEKKYNLAILHFSNFIKQTPGVATAYYQRGLAYKAIENLTEAIADFETAMQNLPKFYVACSAIGMCYLQLQQYDQAFSAFEQALTWKPDWAEALEGRQIVLAKLEEQNELKQITYMPAPQAFFQPANPNNANITNQQVKIVAEPVITSPKNP